MNYKNKIEDFNKNRSELKNNVAIIGRGRWSNVILSELKKNFPKIQKIFVFSNFFEKRYSKNRIKYSNSIRFIKSQNINYFIFASKNEKNISYLKRFLGEKKFLLCEKPLVADKSEIKKMIYYSKKNLNYLSISMQYLYAFYFYFINEKFINKKKVEKIFFNWSDKKKEKRYGFIKKHDYKVEQIYDIFYHVYSIILILTKIRNFKKICKITKFQNTSLLQIEAKKKTFIEIKCSRNDTARKRIIEILFKNKSRLTINFSNDEKVICNIDKKIIKIPSYLLSKTLKYQLYFFLKQKKLNNKDELNNIKNLNNFFKYANLIKKNL